MFHKYIICYFLIIPGPPVSCQCPVLLTLVLTGPSQQQQLASSSPIVSVGELDSQPQHYVCVSVFLCVCVRERLDKNWVTHSHLKIFFRNDRQRNFKKIRLFPACLQNSTSLLETSIYHFKSFISPLKSYFWRITLHMINQIYSKDVMTTFKFKIKKKNFN